MNKSWLAFCFTSNLRGKIRAKRNLITDCWEWQAAKTSVGYGKTYYKGKIKEAHRVAFEECYGTIPPGMVVMHFFCDNKTCVNPCHLRLGTQKENIHDMISKGRKTVLRGEASGNVKLDVKKVKKIRKLWKQKLFQQKDLAVKFGISARQVSAIVSRKYWTHV